MGRPLPAGSEAAFQAKVVGLARLYGWRIYHAPDNSPRRARSGRVYVQNVEAGFPDLVLLRGTELIFAELKTAAGRLSPDQREWLAELELVAGAVNIAGAHAERDGIATHWRDRSTDELVALDGRGVIDNDAGPSARYEAVGAYPRVEVHVWRPDLLDAINDRLSRGRHRLEAV